MFRLNTTINKDAREVDQVVTNQMTSLVVNLKALTNTIQRLQGYSD